MTRMGIGVAMVAIATVVGVPAQEREDRTLLTQAQMTAIINEASGERAMHHVLELVPYQRVRPPEEYAGPYRESQVMANFAKAYGFSNVQIEVFQEGGTAWQPVQGELWMTSPRMTKLFDIYDVALSLASLNANGDLSGELVDVGYGRPEDFDGKDVTGRFVVSAGAPGATYTQAIQRGAIGVLGVSAIGYQRANDYPNQIVSTTVNAQPNTVAWAVTPEVQRNLSAQLARGQRITLRSITRSVQVPAKAEYVRAEIPGDGSTKQEVAVSAHLYEGVIKQGANDDNSGCALTLEIGRTLIKLINEGKLPKPKRTINFLWVPEISGTNAFLTRHPDKAANLIGDLNFDMEGIRLAASRSYWILQRTPDTFPSYINDVAQSMMEYVADISRERVRFRTGGYAPSQPVESPRGSKDAFYIKIDKHYGSSDHVTYMQRGIPAVMFITWPDMWYHSSEDTPDKQDATQYKRAAVVGAGAAAVLASGTDEMAARVLKENLGRGLSRMGESHTKGLGYLADADAIGLTRAYREARVAILHQAAVEKGVVRSASVLWTNVEDGRKKTAAFEPLIDQRASALLNETRAAYQLAAQQRGVTPVAIEPPLTPEEREASQLVVQPVAGAGGRGGAAVAGAAAAGGGRGAGAAGAAGAVQAGRAAGAGAAPPGGGGRGGGGGAGRGAAGPSLPQEMNAEFNLLLPKGLTALEIRDFLSGEFTPLPIADLMAVLRAREAAGTIQLIKR